MTDGTIRVSIKEALEHDPSQEAALQQLVVTIDRANTGLADLVSSASRRTGSQAVRDAAARLVTALKDSLAILRAAPSTHPRLDLSGLEAFDRKLRACEFKMRNRR